MTVKHFNEKNFISLYEKMPQGVICFNNKDIITGINKAGIEIFETKNDYIIGKNFNNLDIIIISEDEKQISPIKKTKKIVNNNKNHDTIIGMYNIKTTKIKWLKVVLIDNIKDGKKIGFYGIFDDITDIKNNQNILKESENALRENQKRLSITFESIGDGVIVVDTSFKITMMNKIAKNILEWDNGYYGKDLNQVFNLKDINIDGSSIKEIAEKVITTKKPYYINQAALYIEKVDKIKIIEDSISPIYNDDEVYGLVIVFRDITEKIQDKQKNKELENQLNQVQKMESIGQFTSGIAHNFNNIITVIIGYISIIESENNGKFKFSNELNEIKKSATRASNLTSQLLTISRKQSTNPIVIDPNIILKSLSCMIKTLVGENIDIKNNFISTNMIKVDENQIEQILLNFAANSKDALNSMSDDKQKQITIGTEDFYATKEYSKQNVGIKEGNYVIITFSDNGPGIPKNIKNKIFDPFFTTKEKGKGTGLGLSTIYGIVKQNDAIIHLNSDIKNGTTFKIFWPITLDKYKENFNKNKTNKNKIIGKENILFIEDEKALQEVAQKYLTKLGYNVILAENGIDGLNKLDNSIDIVIIDMIMPKMSGFELYKKIQKKKKYVKILFTSGYTKDNIVKNISLFKNKDIKFLIKPYSLISLVEKIREILDN